MIGSRIDTPRTDSEYDGRCGVMADGWSCAPLQAMQTEAPLEVALWTNEEHPSFVSVMMGFDVFGNKFSLETARGFGVRVGADVSPALPPTFFS